MLQTGVGQFATGGQVEVLEFDQAGQDWQPRVYTKQVQEITMKQRRRWPNTLQNWYLKSLETPSWDKNQYPWWEVSWPDSDASVLWRRVTAAGAHWWSKGSSSGQTSATGSQRRAPGFVDVGASRGTCGWAEALLAPGWGMPDCCCTACWELRGWGHRMATVSQRSNETHFLENLSLTTEYVTPSLTSHEVDSCSGGQGT